MILDSKGQSSTEHFLGIRAETGGTLQTQQGECHLKSQQFSLCYEKGFSKVGVVLYKTVSKGVINQQFLLRYWKEHKGYGYAT